jgi:RimJ/RimL family protein N-acetyltransferase
MNILGKRVVLRAINKNDSELIVKMFNDPEIEHLVGACNFPMSICQQENWYDTHINSQGSTHHFVIEDTTLGSVGIVRISDLDWKNRSATLGIKLAEKEYQGHGIGTDAYMATMRYCFNELGLHRLTSLYLDYNDPSKRLHSKCGFVEEGRKRESVFQNGSFHDLIITSILSTEYQELVKGNHYWD